MDLNVGIRRNTTAKGRVCQGQEQDGFGAAHPGRGPTADTSKGIHSEVMALPRPVQTVTDSKYRAKDNERCNSQGLL